MSFRTNLLKRGCIVAAVLFNVSVARAQVTITSRDMFNQIGQYYRAYANKHAADGSGDAVVSGLTGTTGGPQFWDFTSGPTDDTYRFDYVGVNADGHGADFPKATIAERKTEAGDGSKAWLFFEQVPGIGRRVYGLYDEKFSPNQPSTPFSTPIIDFPETINYRDTWGTKTSYKTDLVIPGGAPDPADPDAVDDSLTVPILINYSTTATVDGFGIVNQPGVGFGDALRVNELATYDIQADLFGDGQFQSVAQEYIRNLYWLRPNLGIAVQITSPQQDQPPPDNFSTAAAFVRMFETNHSVSTNTTPTGIGGFKITIGSSGVLLSWNKSGQATSYRVEYSANIGGPWSTLGASTTGNFMIDNTNGTAVKRFYRVVGLK